MRLRNFHRKIKKGNQLTDIREITVGTLTATAAITDYETVTRASTATQRVDARLDIPATPWTGSNVTTSLYVTGLYLYIGARGVWGSALIGTG